jgi:polysaccharide biosynthesis PFTS motif protein
LVWDGFQADVIKSSSLYAPILEEVGHIWFSSSDESVCIPINSVAIFDVTPRRSSIRISTGMCVEYNYKVDIANQFLNDIQVVLAKNNLTAVHKIKRMIKTTHKAYLKNIKLLKNESNYVEINPNIDALQVIQKSKACISMPFTSTAVIAKQEGKPSVYYDPSGMIPDGDKAAHGIPVLNGIKELEDWVDELCL